MFKFKGCEGVQVSILERVLDETTRVLRDDEEARYGMYTLIISLDYWVQLEQLTSIEGYERVQTSLTKTE
jgi:hypothetical protein